MAKPAKGSRRAPPPAERRRDAERTRAALLAAAVAEFAAHGYAGARNDAIAARAGVNKQLISYYFGGKRGLHDAILEHWRAHAAQLAPHDLPLEEIVARYAADAVRHADLHRLFLRSGLDGGDDAPRDASGDPDAQLVELRRRQEAGELAGDLDPAMLVLALQGAVAAPLMFGADVRRLTGMDPASEGFAERYAEQLRRLVAHLAGP